MTEGAEGPLTRRIRAVQKAERKEARVKAKTIIESSPAGLTEPVKAEIKTATGYSPEELAESEKIKS